jgi:uroporphyrin-III C-methyltransferase
MNEKDTQNAVEVFAIEDSQPGRRGSGLIAWLALLLALLASAASALAWLQLQSLQDARDNAAAAVPPAVVAAAPREDPRLAPALEELQALRARAGELDRQVRMLGEQGSALKLAFEALGSNDRRDWALAEAEYLERLAIQNLMLGREVSGAIALLQSADAILRDLDEPGLHQARAALARDLASLRAVADFDVEGIYLRLSALAAQVPALLLSERSRSAAASSAAAATPAAPAPGWSERMLATLDRFVVVRRRAQSTEPLLPVGEEQQLRLALQLAMEQAKLGLLAGEPSVYRGALAEADKWVSGYFAPEASFNRTFLLELRELQAIDVAPQLPDISNSLRVLRERDVAAPVISDAPVGSEG